MLLALLLIERNSPCLEVQDSREAGSAMPCTMEHLWVAEVPGAFSSVYSKETEELLGWFRLEKGRPYLYLQLPAKGL